MQRDEIALLLMPFFLDFFVQKHHSPLGAPYPVTDLTEIEFAVRHAVQAADLLLAELAKPAQAEE